MDWIGLDNGAVENCSGRIENGILAAGKTVEQFEQAIHDYIHYDNIFE